VVSTYERCRYNTHVIIWNMYLLSKIQVHCCWAKSCDQMSQPSG
jgi:hypothetical protein